MQSELIVLKREELFDRVWATPVASLAHQYGISGVALGKICRKMGVPVPGRGYWARRASGQKVARPRLGALRAGQVEEHRLYRREPGIPEPEPIVAVRCLEAAPSRVIRVSANLSDPHPLVRRSLVPLKTAARTFTRATRRHRCLDVLVSPEQLDRALRIMEAIIRALEARGHGVEIGTSKAVASTNAANVTRVRINDEWIVFALEERRRQIRLPPPAGKPEGTWYYPRTDLLPTGILKLLITNAPYGEGARATWADTKRRPLETRLNEFVVGLHGVAEAMKLARAKRAKWEAERAEEVRRRQEAAKRDAIERRLRADLDTRAHEWSVAQQQLQYLGAVRTSLEREGEHQQDEAALWLQWALRTATAAAEHAIAGLLDLRPDEREPGGYWSAPSFPREDVVQFLRLRAGPS